jgi:hypothetical protein
MLTRHRRVATRCTRTLGSIAVALAAGNAWGAADPTGMQGIAAAQAPASELKTGWFNSADLSVVITSGNSGTRSYGFDDTFRYVWEKKRFRFRVNYVRSDTADDSFLLVQSGLTFLPGETLQDPPTYVVRPPVELDVEQFLVETAYAQDIHKKLFWNVGASWDRNEDAGIVSRYVGYGGIGNLWYNHDDLSFATSYGLSYTDRKETTPDPEKEDQFFGIRLEYDLRLKMGSSTTFDSDMFGNASLSDLNDYMFDITNSVSVKMSKHVALKASLEWQFNHEPALEDVDILAQVIVVDPDGVPGSGDEYFQTVATGGSEITIGEGSARKEQLDTVFKTALVIDF